jgi:hypothetical protein
LVDLTAKADTTYHLRRQCNRRCDHFDLQQHSRQHLLATQGHRRRIFECQRSSLEHQLPLLQVRLPCRQVQEWEQLCRLQDGLQHRLQVWRTGMHRQFHFRHSHMHTMRARLLQEWGFMLCVRHQLRCRLHPGPRMFRPHLFRQVQHLPERPSEWPHATCGAPAAILSPPAVLTSFRLLTSRVPALTTQFIAEVPVSFVADGLGAHGTFLQGAAALLPSTERRLRTPSVQRRRPLRRMSSATCLLTPTETLILILLGRATTFLHTFFQGLLLLKLLQRRRPHP